MSMPATRYQSRVSSCARVIVERPLAIRRSTRRYPSTYPTTYMRLYQRSAIGPIDTMVGGMRGYGMTMLCQCKPGEGSTDTRRQFSTTEGYLASTTNGYLAPTTDGYTDAPDWDG